MLLLLAFRKIDLVDGHEIAAIVDGGDVHADMAETKPNNLSHVSLLL